MYLKLFVSSVVFLVLFSIRINAVEDALLMDVSDIVRSVGVSTANSALKIIRIEDGTSWISGGVRLELSYNPASTAKIPHTLIALEESYVKDPETLFEWDREERLLEVWNQNHTLQSAYKYSVIWVYQQITRGLGHKVMSSWINRFRYGNRNIGAPEDISTYWVDGQLMTSVEDQIAFLSDLAKENLPLSMETFRNGKLIMCEDSGDKWILYAKTGFSGSVGWYVGWVETTSNEKKQTYVFAFNMDIDNWDKLPKRKEVVRQLFYYLGILPKASS